MFFYDKASLWLLADGIFKCGGVSMKKGKGLANRIAAMLLSGMLVVGTAPGIVLASETRADSGRTS